MKENKLTVTVRISNLVLTAVIFVLFLQQTGSPLKAAGYALGINILATLPGALLVGFKAGVKAFQNPPKN